MGNKSAARFVLVIDVAEGVQGAPAILSALFHSAFAGESNTRMWSRSRQRPRLPWSFAISPMVKPSTLTAVRHLTGLSGSYWPLRQIISKSRRLKVRRNRALAEQNRAAIGKVAPPRRIPVGHCRAIRLTPSRRIREQKRPRTWRPSVEAGDEDFGDAVAVDVGHVDADVDVPGPPPATRRPSACAAGHSAKLEGGWGRDDHVSILPSPSTSPKAIPLNACLKLAPFQNCGEISRPLSSETKGDRPSPPMTVPCLSIFSG